MHISISGQHLNTGESLQQYVTERVEQTVGKYFENAISANIHFTKQHNSYSCELIVNDGTKRHDVVKSAAECDEVYSSFDNALVRLEKQLRKYKSRLKDRHNRIKVSEIIAPAMKYTIQPHREEQEITEDAPLIISEKPIEIAAMSVSDAVMKMDLEDLPAVAFFNEKTKRINIVYYRKDGNIAWVDTQA